MATAIAAPQVPQAAAQQIWVYNHVRTKQVVYSLQRALNNKKAIAQIPFMGKKTVPASLRKDMWRPLCVIDMPSSYQCRKAYHEMREFKKRHSLEWTIPDYARKTKKTRKKILMNEKPNTIADIAFVLTRQKQIAEEHAAQAAERKQNNEEALAKATARLDEIRAEKKTLRDASDEASIKRLKELKNEKMKLVRNMAKPVPYLALKGTYSPLNDPSTPSKRGIGSKRGRPENPLFTMDGVKIAWTNVLDAHYAKEWPSSILHSDIKPERGRNRYVGRLPRMTARAPPTGVQAQQPNTTSAQVRPSSGDADSAEPKSWLGAIVARLQGGRKGVNHV